MGNSVFIVFYYRDFIGCFSTKEKAQNYIDEDSKSEKRDFLAYWNRHLEDLSVRYKDFDTYYSYVEDKNKYVISEINIQ